MLERIYVYTPIVILSSWYTSDFELNAVSERRCCSAGRWKQQPMDSTFSTWLTSFFTSPDVDLHWTDCVAVSTDGAPAMVGITGDLSP